jgi:hypothetical protein
MLSFRRLTMPLLALAAGCAATWTVDTFEDPGAQLTERPSFAWTGGEVGSVVTVRPALVSATDAQVRDAVVKVLLRKGYDLAADPKQAQMLVSYQVAGARKYVTNEKPRFNAPSPNDVLMSSNPPPPAASELPREQQITQGSVIVFVADPESGKLIWRGAITSETRTGSSKQAIEDVARMAADIAESFPARSGHR